MRAAPASSAAYRSIVFAQLGEANDFGRKSTGIPYTATIAFAIDSRGAVTSAIITKPSSQPSFDARVLAMVRKAAPYPPPPGARGTVTATIAFKAGARP